MELNGHPGQHGHTARKHAVQATGSGNLIQAFNKTQFYKNSVT